MSVESDHQHFPRRNSKVLNAAIVRARDEDDRKIRALRPRFIAEIEKWIAESDGRVIRVTSKGGSSQRAWSNFVQWAGGEWARCDKLFDTVVREQYGGSPERFPLVVKSA